MDKSPETFAFVCRKEYLRRIVADLNDGNTFSNVQQILSAIILQQSVALQHLGIRAGHEAAASYFAMAKIHKNDYRFITGANNVYTTPASCWLNAVSRALDPFASNLLTTSLAGFPGLDTHGFSTILKNSTQLVEIMKAFNSNNADTYTSLQTGDFSRLYTHLPLQNVIDTLKSLYSEVFSNNKIGLKVFLRKGRNPVWVDTVPAISGRAETSAPNDPYKFMIFSISHVHELLEFILTNTYVAFGPWIKLQQIGISMGGNHSVFTANHYLFAFELAFFRQLKQAIIESPPTNLNVTVLPDIASPNAHRGDIAVFLAKSFLWLSRYIDDLHSFNNIVLSKLLYTNNLVFGFHGLYPPELNITLSDVQNFSNFLDLTIQSRHADGKTPLCTILYSKFREEKFRGLPIIRYPHMSSNLSLSLKINVLVGQFHRLRQIITERDNFVDELAAVMNTLFRRGYNARAMRRRVYRLCLNSDGMYGWDSRYCFTRINAVFTYMLESSS